MALSGRGQILLGGVCSKQGKSFLYNWKKKRGRGGWGWLFLTVWRMLLHDLHRPHDARLFAVGVVEEGQFALLHGAEVVACHVVADPCLPSPLSVCRDTHTHLLELVFSVTLFRAPVQGYLNKDRW